MSSVGQMAVGPRCPQSRQPLEASGRHLLIASSSARDRIQTRPCRERMFRSSPRGRKLSTKQTLPPWALRLSDHDRSAYSGGLRALLHALLHSVSQFIQPHRLRPCMPHLFQHLTPLTLALLPHSSLRVIDNKLSVPGAPTQSAVDYHVAGDFSSCCGAGSERYLLALWRRCRAPYLCRPCREMLTRFNRRMRFGSRRGPR
jgi:hypothetical protein